MVRAAGQQEHAQFAFQTRELLAQRRLDDMFTRGRPAEVQLLGERDEIAQLP